MTRIRRTYREILESKERELEEIRKRVADMEASKNDPLTSRKTRAIYALKSLEASAVQKFGADCPLATLCQECVAAIDREFQ